MFVCEKHNEAFTATWEVISIKALELLCETQILAKFTASLVPDGAVR